MNAISPYDASRQFIEGQPIELSGLDGEPVQLRLARDRTLSIEAASGPLTAALDETQVLVLAGVIRMGGGELRTNEVAKKIFDREPPEVNRALFSPETGLVYALGGVVVEKASAKTIKVARLADGETTDEASSLRIDRKRNEAKTPPWLDKPPDVRLAKKSNDSDIWSGRQWRSPGHTLVGEDEIRLAQSTNVVKVPENLRSIFPSILSLLPTEKMPVVRLNDTADLIFDSDDFIRTRVLHNVLQEWHQEARLILGYFSPPNGVNYISTLSKIRGMYIDFETNHGHSRLNPFEFRLLRIADYNEESITAEELVSRYIIGDDKVTSALAKSRIIRFAKAGLVEVDSQGAASVDPEVSKVLRDGRWRQTYKTAA